LSLTPNGVSVNSGKLNKPHDIVFVLSIVFTETPACHDS